MPTTARKDRRYTYADYAKWPDDVRCELIGGIVYDMSPAPSTLHQRLLVRLTSMLYGKLKGHPCEVFMAPTDVVLSQFDVVQPDLFILCDRSKVTHANIQGAPDIVIELLSPGTTLKDLQLKKKLYERHGVKEYILFHPGERYAEQYTLSKNRYGDAKLVTESGTIVFRSLSGLKVSMAEVLED